MGDVDRSNVRSGVRLWATNALMLYIIQRHKIDKLIISCKVTAIQKSETTTNDVNDDFVDSIETTGKAAFMWKNQFLFSNYNIQCMGKVIFVGILWSNSSKSTISQHWCFSNYFFFLLWYSAKPTKKKRWNFLWFFGKPTNKILWSFQCAANELTLKLKVTLISRIAGE